MREIKFIGKRQHSSKWSYGSFIDNTQCDFGSYIQDDNGNLHTIHRETVGQYTGLVDKNGREIYEGDCFVKLVSYINFEEETTTFGKEVCVVKFHEGKFTVYQDGWGHFELLDVIKQKHDGYDRWESGEIIGNIYENPELLEGN